MSVVGHLIDDDDKCETVTEDSELCYDIKSKFEIYQTKAELINNEYKEAKEVINRLREEINESRETEKSQRSYVSSLQRRLQISEEKRKLILSVLERQRESERAIQTVESKLTVLNNGIQELKQKCQAVINSSVMALEISEKKRRLLETSAKDKEILLNGLRKEIESITIQKNDLIQNYESQISRLQEELENSRSDKNITVDQFNQTIHLYKQQITTYEKTIKEMERERKSILEDYEQCPFQSGKHFSVEDNINEKGVTCPDSTVPCFYQERENILVTGNMDTNSRTESYRSEFFNDTNELFNDGCSRITDVLPKKTSEGKISAFPNPVILQKTPLNFIHKSGESRKAGLKGKRRLYSENDDFFN